MIALPNRRSCLRVSFRRRRIFMKINLLFLGKFYLVADDISVLDFILNEGLLQLHSLDHTRLDFLLRH